MRDGGQQKKHDRRSGSPYRNWPWQGGAGAAGAFRRTQNTRPVWRWVREGREGARRRSGGVVASPWKACGKIRTVQKQACTHVPKGRRAQACVREEREENGAREKQ